MSVIASDQWERSNPEAGSPRLLRGLAMTAMAKFGGEDGVSKPDHRKPEPRSCRPVKKRPARRDRERRQSLAEFFRHSPLAEAMAAGEIDLGRDRDEIRDLDL
jgi:hypothetical protein